MAVLSEAGLPNRDFFHQPVMADEVVQLMNPEDGNCFVDATIGGGGHAEQLLARMQSGARLIGLDQDVRALQAARERLQMYHDRVTFVHTNFARLDRVLDDLGIKAVDGFLFDLGVSSPQLDVAERGFSYREDAPLDMRMDETKGPTAADLVNRSSEEQLRRWIWEYGEERFAPRIAREIVRRRSVSPLKTTSDLVEAIKAAIPAPARRNGPHPARRTFQALRIAVNRELDVLAEALEKAADRLAPGGRLLVISFHSLEDRIVKRFFQKESEPCVCPKEIPVCRCNRVPRLRILTRRPKTASDEELAKNPRARSAKLRAAVRVLSEGRSE